MHLADGLIASEARRRSSSGGALYSALGCHAFTAEPVAKQGASTMRASSIKQRAHWLACGGLALFFLHLRITGSTGRKLA